MPNDLMTPEQARKHQAWHAEYRNGTRSADLLDQALATIAADQIEYGVEYTGVNHGHRHTGSKASWHTKLKHAEMEYRQMVKSGMNPRLVARRVSTPWEVGE